MKKLILLLFTVGVCAAAVSYTHLDDWNTANKIVEGVTELRNA